MTVTGTGAHQIDIDNDRDRDSGERDGDNGRNNDWNNRRNQGLVICYNVSTGYLTLNRITSNELHNTNMINQFTLTISQKQK